MRLMGVPTSEVGYTPAMPRWEDHEVHKGMWWHCGGGGGVRGLKVASGKKGPRYQNPAARSLKPLPTHVLYFVIFHVYSYTLIS